MKHLGVLVEATNKVLGSERVTPEKLQEIFNIGCNTLTMLVGDHEFLDALRMAKAHENLQPEIRDTFDDLKRFQQFLELERRALQEAGISSGVENFLIQQALKIRQQIPNWQTDPEAILMGLKNLRSATCLTASRLNDSNQEREPFGDIKNLAKRVGFGIGGAAVIGINGKRFAVGDLTGLLSIEFGKKLIGKAFD